LQMLSLTPPVAPFHSNEPEEALASAEMTGERLQGRGLPASMDDVWGTTERKSKEEACAS
jgi:hypothetical protein